MKFRPSPDLIVAANPTLLAKGCVNIIRLNALRDHAGARWNRICEGVYTRIETLLRNILGPLDFYARIDDSSYLVTMPTAEPEEINMICLRIAFDLHRSFMGQCALSEIHVGTVMASEHSGEMLVRPLPSERVKILADKAGIRPDPPANGNVPDAPHAPGGAARASVAALPPAPEFRPLTITHEFIPIWSARQSAITTYLCSPKTITTINRRDSVPLTGLTSSEHLEVEMACLNRGIPLLHKSAREGNQFILALAFSFDVLGSPAGRKAILEALHDLRNDYRSYLSITINEVPAGVAQSRLATMVTLVTPFVRSVSATVAPHSVDFHAYQGIGLKFIGYSLREFGRNGAPTQHEIEQMALFARRNNLGTFLAQVSSNQTLKYAQDAGVALLSGTAVAPAFEEPRGVLRLSWEKLMSESLVELWV